MLHFKKLFFVLFLLLNFSTKNFAQISANDSLRLIGMAKMVKDTIQKIDISKLDSIIKKPYKIIPRLATKRSAIIPGWGQLYIKQKLWVPIIYGGFGVATYFIITNSRDYRAFKTAYIKTSTENALNSAITKGIVHYKGIDQEFSIANLKNGTNYYHRYRDFAWLSLPVIWAINVLEVNVSAHLKSFDMTDDISMKFEPSFAPEPFSGLPTVGGKVVFAFR